MLTDRGTEYCGHAERHDHELYLTVENIDHSRTKARSPQTNGICERFHKTLLDEFYRVAFRKKLYRRIDELEADLDLCLIDYNEQQPHPDRWCYGNSRWSNCKLPNWLYSFSFGATGSCPRRPRREISP